MGFLSRHTTEDGVVTNQSLIAASEDMVSELRASQREWQASGATDAANDAARLIDQELDKQAELRRRI